MQKRTERRQLNNEGFSLIELLIAIVILSIIVVPLLHSFVTSARTNAKSRNTMHATACLLYTSMATEPSQRLEKK